VSEMYSDSNLQTHAVNVLQVRPELGDSLKNIQTRFDRFERCFALILDPEKSHQAVSHVTVDASTVSANDPGHVIVITVEDVDDVIRRKTLGEPGKTANISK